LVVLDESGRVLGALPPFDVPVPWWMEVADVIAGAREHGGVDVTVLRLLQADRPRHPGGTVHYSVQLNPPAYGPDHPAYGRLTPVSDDVRALAESDHPRRAAYARPGGPQATLAWGVAALDPQRVLAAQQQRTWNLSAIWRLDTESGRYWLKEVPEFFGHEGAALRWLIGAGYGDRLPSLIDESGLRLLMAESPGEALYDADMATRLAIAADMHAIQRDAPVDELLDIGVPDRRRLAPRLTEVARAYGDPADERLHRLVDELPDRLARVDGCGLPDALVHGDLHSGNVIGAVGGPRVILDWGDCVVGHPAIDIIRLAEGLPADQASTLQEAWADWWREAVPGCDPVTALELMRPVYDLYYAAVYADFLAAIEPSEHRYHAADVPDCLARATGGAQ
jgi:hypothetical protein